MKEEFKYWLRETYYEGLACLAPSERETETGLEFPRQGTRQFAEDVWYGTLVDEYPNEIDDESAVEVLMDYKD